MLSQAANGLGDDDDDYDERTRTERNIIFMVLLKSHKSHFDSFAVAGLLKNVVKNSKKRDVPEM